MATETSTSWGFRTESWAPPAIARGKLAGKNHQRKVLIIDDESDIADVLTDCLSAHHLRCFRALTPEAGFEKVQKLKPDLILLDLMLPHMSGLGFLREIKWDHALSKIPVIVFTALGDEEIAREAIGLGASGFLRKDCTLKELVSMVQAYT